MAVGEPPDESGRRQRRGWWIAAGLLVLLLAIALVVLWVKAPALYGRGDAAKTAAATTRGAILTVIAALIAAAAAGAGLSMTARTIRINQQALAETQRANQASNEQEREAQVTDRYTKAIGQLGDTQLAIRLGGIYALERIAVDSDRDHRTVVEVLSAFIRTSSQPAASNRSLDDQPGTPPKEQRTPAAPPASSTGQALPIDVLAALTVLGRLPSRPGVSRGDLTSAHLAGATLYGASLAGATLYGASLAGATLYGANLASADLRRANLAGATLYGASLTDANLRRANLIATNFYEANLAKATLYGTNLTGADLTKGNLTDATLTEASLAGADLTEANLAGADLTEANLADTKLYRAKNLTQQQLGSARGNEDTKLPAGLQRPVHWSVGPATPPAAER